MSLSRRKFLKTGAFLSAALILKPTALVLGRDYLWTNTPSNPGAGHFYNRETFSPYVGDVFGVRVGKQIVDLKLVALEDVPQRSRGITTGKVAGTDCFSMRFHTAAPLPARSGLYKLNHKKLGQFDLFVSQSKQNSKSVLTAIVNQLG